MAVSGRKLSDFSGSLSQGSAEDVDHFCDPCLTTGHLKDAHKYCLDSGKFLCKTCSDCHLKTRLLRNHQLADKDKVGKRPTTQDSDVCTEKCPEHKQKVIKYFCPQHETLCCNDCMTMYHRTCEIDYIPDKCADIANSEEYRKIVHRLELKLQELNKIMQTTKVRDHETDQCHYNFLQEILKFRKEINDYLDQLQQKIQKEADKKNPKTNKLPREYLMGVIVYLQTSTKMQSILHANETSGKYGQLYIAVKQAQSVLRSDQIKAEDGLERRVQQYIFERNNSLMDMLSKQDAFGKLTLTSVLTTPSRNMETFQALNKKEDHKSVQSPRMYMKTFQKLTKKGDIKVRTKFDKNGCWVTGCAVLSSNKLVIADRDNKKLKLVNIQTKSVVEETLLDSRPWDVAVLSQDQIAVTMPDKGQVVIMTYDDRLSVVHTISATGHCRGYLVVSEDSKLLYISDRDKDYVVSITLQGEVTSVYKHKDLRRPRGMLMLDDGSLLVCCYYNNFIDHISGDLKQGHTVIDGLS